MIKHSLLVLLSCCCYCLGASSAASTPLIPFRTQNEYQLNNKVTIKELSSHGSKEETSYTFNSQLFIYSVWHSEKEQLLELYFRENSVTAPGKNGKQHKKDITKITDRPFYISLIDNKPNKVIAHSSRDQSLLNIERGIASLLQIQYKNGLELDVSGQCKVFYNVKSSTRVEKTKSDCSLWDLKVIERSEKVLGVSQKSLETIEFDLSAEGHLLKATSVETHQMSLTAKSDAGSQIESVFTLKHIKAAEEPNQLEFTTLDKAIESLLEWYRVFDIEADVDGAISEIKGMTLKQQIASYAKFLDDSFVGNETLAKAFVELLPIARITKEDEFVEILKANEKLHYQLVDLLAAVQTIDAHKAVHAQFQYDNKEHRSILENYLKSLSVATHPDRAIIEDLFSRLQSKENRIKSVKLIDSITQCIASLAHKTNLDVNDSLGQHIKKSFVEALEINCKRSKDPVSCQTRYIRALQNLQDPSTIGILIEYALSNEVNTISVTAMQALKSFPSVLFTQQHVRMFEEIFYQLRKKYDSTARISALDIILAMKPTRDQLSQLLDYLNSRDKEFEIKTYVIQKLKMTAEKCHRFRALLESCLYERPHINNYHVMGQKGLTTVLSRQLSWSPAFDESLLSVQEINKGVLKRGSVELILSAGQQQTSTFKLGIYTSGLSSFVSEEDSTDSSDAVAADDEMPDDSPSTAGMEISVQGVLQRPLVFFTGQTELMGHVWKGTVTEPTPAYQATTLSQDNEQYVVLSSGASAYVRVIGSKSVELNGRADFSLWNRNANTEIKQNAGAAVNGIMKAGFTYAHVSNEFLISYEPCIALLADLDFYTGIKLCMKLQRPTMSVNYSTTKTVSIQNIDAKAYTKKIHSKSVHKFPGVTFALNQKNNEMCNMIHK